jgi:hypothetical protein
MVKRSLFYDIMNKDQSDLCPANICQYYEGNYKKQ